MKKTAAILMVFVLLVAGIFFMLFNNSSGQDTPMPETTQTPPAEDDFPITKEQFESLPIVEQQEILEEFVADFWQDELAPVEIAAPEKKYLSLDIFNRPYMQTITEREFSQLSPEDQEKAIAETTETCREIRVHILDVIAQAK